MGEMSKKESDKVQDKGKKDEKKGDKFVEQSTYLSENLCLTSLSPGPGGYNPYDQAVWNRIARDNNEKKGQPQTKGKAEGDKKNQGDKKKLEKPQPGPGTYEVKSGFPEVEKKDMKKAEKKDKDEKDKKDSEKPVYIFGKRVEKHAGLDPAL